jgi:type III pantothenate kinase
MKNFVIDIGNSNIVLGIYENDLLLKKLRLYSDKSGTEQYYRKQIEYQIEVEDLDISEFGCAALSSVVPELTDIMVNSIAEVFNCRPKILTPWSELGLKFPVKDPSYIGSDLIVNAYAAKSIYKTNCIICDLGTATTIQLVGKDGYFHGYAIAPGLKTSTECVCSKSSQLSLLELGHQKDVLGTDTKSALLSGLVKGHAFMLKGFIHTVKEKYSKLENFKTIVTGGLSSIIKEDLKEIDVIDENLTLDGLNLFCRQNQ